MLLAIANDNEWYTKHLRRAVMLAPCFYRFYPAFLWEWYYNNSLKHFRDSGIYALYGPNWEEDAKKICETYDYLTCLLYTEDTEYM